MELCQHTVRLNGPIDYWKTIPYNIVLIGFMGSGKTTLGRYLAQITGFRCYDVDDVIEQQEGCSVQEIFRISGEAYFRSLEQKTVARLSSLEHVIIACGGGVVLNYDNVSHLRNKGKLVWLKATSETIYGRLKNQNDRPLLSDKGIDDIDAMLKGRFSYYETATDYEINTDDKSVVDIGNEILNLLIHSPG